LWDKIDSIPSSISTATVDSCSSVAANDHVNDDNNNDKSKYESYESIF